ncbi:MAG TPA: hypothetical protein VNJ29_01820 [Candidatus Nitrosotenuis sp.]|jgi:hypothetical protein|nr:hypothetical protein [Candidatus Nitrosotenuis sp.]
MIKSLIFLSNIIIYITLSEAAELDYNTLVQKITCKNFSLPSPYRAYSSDGIDHDLENLVLTISSFAKSDNGSYEFLDNKDHPIRLEDGFFQNQSIKGNTPIAAMAMAFEIYGVASNLGGSVRPCKRITNLDKFVFDFGNNLSIKELELITKMQGMHTLKVKLIARLKDGQEIIYKKRGEILNSKSAPTTTFLSSASPNSSYNIFWKNCLSKENSVDS